MKNEGKKLCSLVSISLGIVYCILPFSLVETSCLEREYFSKKIKIVGPEAFQNLHFSPKNLLSQRN